MQLLDATLSLPEANLALDEVLLLTAEEEGAGETLRLWEWPRLAVVLGSGCRLAEDVDEAACQADGVPILRRSSGGGTVLLGAGCLLFSLVLAYDRDPALREIRSSYTFILNRIREALTGVDPPIELAGTSDLAVAGRKFSGNAQQRKRSYLLHHGTLLYDFALNGVDRYLRVPARQPEYREGRTHESFLTNLPLSAIDLRRRLQTIWGADVPLPTWPADVVQQLIIDKYLKPEWIRRR